MRLIAGYIGKAGNMKIEEVHVGGPNPRPIREDEDKEDSNDNRGGKLKC